MKKIILSIAALVFLLGCAKKQPANGPHFVKDVTAVLAKDQMSVLVSWKEAGLGNGDVDYRLSAAGSATYVCVNNAGKCPNAENKTTVYDNASTTLTLTAGENGQIEGTLIIFPIGAGEFACPGGQNLALADFSLIDITLEDETNGITASAVPDSLGAVLFICP